MEDEREVEKEGEGGGEEIVKTKGGEKERRG